jgi:hypothetical protein
LKRKQAALEQQIARLRSEYESEEAELRRRDEQAGRLTRVLVAERTELARLRQADDPTAAGARGNSKLKKRK